MELVLRLNTQLRPRPARTRSRHRWMLTNAKGGCSATVTIRVRRPAAAPAPADPPENPPGEIPAILTDGDGNQYEVFTPEGGGTFTGEGFSLSAGAGAIPNLEYIGIRVSDEGSASNAGMTHQRYTLGGNMYKVSAVDASSAAISSYELSSAAKVCLPLPDELRTNIADLAIVAINADGSLTILSTSVRIGSAGADVCGNISGIPASVAVGSEGAPAAIPTATPEPTPEPARDRWHRPVLERGPLDPAARHSHRDLRHTRSVRPKTRKRTEVRLPRQRA